MSIAEDSANLTANFKDKKIKEVLSDMSLDVMALVWSDIRTAHEAPAEDKAAQEKDFKEKSDALHEIVTPEKLQSQINEYMEGLANGSYSPADFSKISEFCDSFSEEFQNDAVKATLSEMKKRMAEKRLDVENPVTIINDKLPENLNIQELDSIVIEGDKEKVDALEDKTSAKGKTISFKGAEDKDLGTVAFDEQGIADITFTNENNEAQHYQISADGTLMYLPEGQEPQQISEEMKKSEGPIRAMRLAASAQKVWKNYSKGELDNAVDKSITVKEGGKSTRISEEKNKTTVNETKETTKVDEGNDENDPLSKTTFNEEKSEEKNEGEANSGTKNEHGKPEDELYWVEADIIDTMFKEWFLKAAKAATNWVFHQIEYDATGIWNELEAAFNARKNELKEKRKEEKEDKTQKLFKDVKTASDKHMKPLTDEYNKSAEKNIINAVKAGNIDEAIADHKLLQSLGTYADVKTLLSQGNPETNVPFVMGTALMAATFSDDYAQASILNAQMNNPEAFKGQNMEQVYASKQLEAQQVLKTQMLAYKQEHPNENPANAMYNAIQSCTDDMKKAKGMAIEDFNNKRYVENGKNPRRNEILEAYEGLEQTPPSQENSREGEPATQTPAEPDRTEEPATPTPAEPDRTDEPTPMADEADRQAHEDSRIEYIKNGLQMEGANLDGRQQDVLTRRQNLERTKDFILEGFEQNRPPLLQEQQQPRPQQPQIKPPFKPQGRE